MTETKTEPLSMEDMQLVAMHSRSYELGRIAELVSLATDARDQLRELWEGFQRRHGPAEVDVRDVVERALGRVR
ncbi:MAG: hypothetical protein U0900_02205 [Myxococcota bacterium]